IVDGYAPGEGAEAGDEDDESPTAADITARALAGEAHAHATLSTFCALLGGAAGNLALTLGARGGVYVGGGIPPRIEAFLAASAFRARFEDKGRFAEYLEPIPTWLIDARAPALRGAAHALARSEACGAARSWCGTTDALAPGAPGRRTGLRRRPKSRTIRGTDSAPPTTGHRRRRAFPASRTDMQEEAPRSRLFENFEYDAPGNSPQELRRALANRLL